MDIAHRKTTSSLGAELNQNAESYGFFPLMQAILADIDHDVEEQALRPQAPSGVRFSVDPSLGFPRSDVLDVDAFDEDADVRYDVMVSFLGLHGSSSPLPDHLVETSNWSQGELNVQRSFNDFFSNRLIWFFYLIWRKYRYYIRYEPEASDQFSDWMFSLIGIGGKENRGSADVPWAKLLTYLGVVAARTRSAGLVSGVIAHAFNLQSIDIRQLELRTVDIPEDQRSYTGLMNCKLGHDMTIGSSIKDIGGKFTIVIRELSFERLRDFLPNGRDYPRLKELVEFLLKDQLAYDIELHVIEHETPQFTLGRESVSKLGWTTFLGDAANASRKPIVLAGRS